MKQIYGRSKAYLRKFGNCEPNIDYPAKYNVSFTTIGDQQYTNGVLIVKAPLDNNISVSIFFQLFIENKKHRNLKVD